MVHSHLRFSQLLREPELIVEKWVTLYYMGAFRPAIWSTIVWTEKFNNGLCTHFLRLHGLKSSCNSSRLKNRRCELSLKARSHGAAAVPQGFLLQPLPHRMGLEPIYLQHLAALLPLPHSMNTHIGSNAFHFFAAAAPCERTLSYEKVPVDDNQMVDTIYSMLLQYLAIYCLNPTLYKS